MNSEASLSHRRPSRAGAALEAILTLTAGATIAWLALLPLGAGFAGLGAVVAGVNGALSGARGIYSWRTKRGLLAFLLDSTLGLPGTALALVIQSTNPRIPGAHFRSDLSRRRNRHVFAGGVHIRLPFAFTLGNVISNAACGGDEVNDSFITNHEELHVWQARMFGPLFQGTYIVWGVVGTLVATAVWLRSREESLGSLIETATYYNNPFEYWAYRNDRYWPPRPANLKIAWGPRRRGSSPEGGDQT